MLKVMINRFKNGSFVSLHNNDWRNSKPLIVINDDVENPFDMSKDVFHENLVDFSNVKKMIITKTPKEYLLTDKTSKLQKTITPDVYEKLTTYFKEQYVASKELIETKTFEDVELIIFGDFDFDYEEINDNYKVRGVTVQPVFLSFEQCKFSHLLPCQLEVGALYDNIAEGVKDYLKNISYLCDRKVEVWYGSIQISIYEEMYTGKMKDQEIYTSNGRSYAKRRYKSIRDLPRVKYKFQIEKKELKPLYAKNSKELKEKLNLIIDEILTGEMKYAK